MFVNVFLILGLVNLHRHVQTLKAVVLLAVGLVPGTDVQALVAVFPMEAGNE